tara:strand:+ start:519 stop:632 length:114 start_codon:yes stop_codon:yes gene_type:complete
MISDAISKLIKEILIDLVIKIGLFSIFLAILVKKVLF